MSKHDGALLEVRWVLHLIGDLAEENIHPKLEVLMYRDFAKEALTKLNKLITNMPSGIEHALKNHEVELEYDEINDEHLRLFGRQIHHTLAEAAEQFYDAVREKQNE